MQFQLTITLGNEAMQTSYEVQHAIHESLRRYGYAVLEGGMTAPLRDQHGNTVGKWEVAEKKSDSEIAAELSRWSAWASSICTNCKTAGQCCLTHKHTAEATCLHCGAKAWPEPKDGDQPLSEEEGSCPGGCGRAEANCAHSETGTYCADIDEYRDKGEPETWEQFEGAENADASEV